jgi:hypothetical protein
MARSSASRVRSTEQVGSGGESVQRPASRKEEKAPAEGKRKVLQMNVRGGQAQQPKVTPAAQHATGSFTGTSGGPRKG